MREEVVAQSVLVWGFSRVLMHRKQGNPLLSTDACMNNPSMNNVLSSVKSDFELYGGMLTGV